MKSVPFEMVQVIQLYPHIEEYLLLLSGTIKKLVTIDEEVSRCIASKENSSRYMFCL